MLFQLDLPSEENRKNRTENRHPGAQTSLKFPLPGIFSKNAKSAFEHGSLLTDIIAHWVKSEMVAGPFDFPPLENFRVNSLMAVKQKNKVRPILNLSAPKYASFNDAVYENCANSK